MESTTTTSRTRVSWSRAAILELFTALLVYVTAFGWPKSTSKQKKKQKVSKGDTAWDGIAAKVTSTPVTGAAAQKKWDRITGPQLKTQCESLMAEVETKYGELALKMVERETPELTGASRDTKVQQTVDEWTQYIRVKDLKPADILVPKNILDKNPVDLCAYIDKLKKTKSKGIDGVSVQEIQIHYRRIHEAAGKQSTKVGKSSSDDDDDNDSNEEVEDIGAASTLATEQSSAQQPTSTSSKTTTAAANEAAALAAKQVRKRQRSGTEHETAAITALAEAIKSTTQPQLQAQSWDITARFPTPAHFFDYVGLTPAQRQAIEAFGITTSFQLSLLTHDNLTTLANIPAPMSSAMMHILDSFFGKR